jgi:hypothetical protein
MRTNRALWPRSTCAFTDKSLIHNMADHSSTSQDFELASQRSAAALRELEERARNALAISRQQVKRLEAEITGQLEAIAATIASEREAESTHNAAFSEVQSQIDQITADHAAAKAAWALERTELESDSNELAQQVARLESEQRASREDWARQLIEFERKLREQQSAWNDQLTEWTDARTALESERDALQQKFELALQDVQRYRGRVAELEQDLARRPETTQTDSAELVALRAERDALAERAAQLEKESATKVDAANEQQLADLQRRFELAVEDVRELKTKNAKLESQLAAGGGQPVRSADNGDMDWESQKRRLLASLEDEGEATNDLGREDERIRIAGTIEMTDAVIAEKDREIAALKTQLMEAGTRTSENSHSQKISELVDADEVIAQHRERIAKMEREMDATLRAAELELSLERAKMARERVELDELRADLASARQDYGPNGPPPPGAPRRRWLSKLGLSGDE